MFRIIVPLLIIFASCSMVHNFPDKIEEEHNSLYKQKALIVMKVDSRKVYFTNPTGTKCYFLSGREYTSQWEPGDTFVIDNHLNEFYKLHYAKKTVPCLSSVHPKTLFITTMMHY